MKPDDPIVVEAVRLQLEKRFAYLRVVRPHRQPRSAAPGRIKIFLKALRDAGFGVCVTVSKAQS